ncbi:hypothetical protein SAMN06272735_0195 [Streptomyces sp. TLI_55]|uniref:hypothetical protein n=1 Tax=Streptomyces sp. TLI_55 TaxID=1938861 RepID=UPI000BC45729|nr:hypothetical protein [Streptomyces sp. TLI_55]SNX55764.1 hypothetical protein SAMN06272735_0195 [Streptomyces sp. TLI_55]
MGGALVCKVDHEAAAVTATAALTAAYPHLRQEACLHPALEGCEDVEWSSVPGCRVDVPVVLRGLADPDAAEMAERALDWLVMSGPMSISATMPAVVPYLLRLTADPSVPRRNELFGLLLAAAALSAPTDPDSAWDMAVGGPEEDHPERALCRAAFVADAAWVRRLLADDELLAGFHLDDGDRASLVQAAGL